MQLRNKKLVVSFKIFDRDRTGSFSFDEFLNGVGLMNHGIPHHDRIDYLVRQNNTSGHISSQYGHQIFRRLNDYYGLPRGTEHQCWQQVDTQNRGYVTQQELMNYISQQQGYNERYQ